MAGLAGSMASAAGVRRASTRWPRRPTLPGPGRPSRPTRAGRSTRSPPTPPRHSRARRTCATTHPPHHGMPRRGINWFYLMIAFGIGYLAWYGGLGGIDGISGWSSEGEHALAKAADDARLEETFAPYKGRPIDEIATDPAAIKLGQSIFSNNCATCHGSSAQGAIGFPNLGDDIWHWGGSPEEILTSILDGREGVMPEWGTVLTGMGGDSAVISVVAYVRSLSDPARSGDYLAVQGRVSIK